MVTMAFLLEVFSVNSPLSSVRAVALSPANEMMAPLMGVPLVLFTCEVSFSSCAMADAEKSSAATSIFIFFMFLVDDSG